MARLDPDPIFDCIFARLACYVKYIIAKYVAFLFQHVTLLHLSARMTRAPDWCSENPQRTTLHRPNINPWPIAIGGAARGCFKRGAAMECAMSTFVRLKQPLGPTYPSDEEDTLLTKHLLTDVGHFEIPRYGITPWPDDPLFSGIDSFQRRKSLDVDSLMLPGGPTEKALNEELTRLKLPLRQDRDCDQERVEPAIRLPGGIWRRDNCPAPADDECDRQFEADIRRCAQIAGGDRRLYRICHDSAMERLAACIANRPLPPLYEG